MAPAPLAERAVGDEFRRLLAAGARLRPAGTASADPGALLRQGYAPRFKVELFDATFYLTSLLENQDFRFFVAHTILGLADRGPRVDVFPRIVYKDQSLVWRTATHYIYTEEETWIGKGALKPAIVDGEEVLASAEETTNLPFEMQDALDVLSRRGSGVRRDLRAAGRILRNAPRSRYDPYRDFSAPRERAQADPRNLVHGGRPIAWFEQDGDPASLRFAEGFCPDFEGGVIEVAHSRSRMYDGEVRKLRILSQNRQIQYLFVDAPRLVWIIPPQTLTSELSSYGVRTLDVEAHEDVFVPGYEYHFEDDEGLFSQIPEGFAGAQSGLDDYRADASPWLEKLPVIQDFRRVLGRPSRLRA